MCSVWHFLAETFKYFPMWLFFQLCWWSLSGSDLASLLFADHTRCNVWILDGDLYHKGLLKFAVSAESLPETLVIFVADMSRPWTVMESLQKWASVLREHIDKMKIPPEEMRELERKCK